MLFAVLLSFALSEYVDITSKNVDSVIGGKQPALVKFYSPNCPHCRNMAEAFADAAKAFKDVTFGGVDCTAESSICSKYRVNGYPTVYIFAPGKTETLAEYSGSRTVDDFIDFVENYTDAVGKREKKILPELDPTSFDSFVGARKCTFVTFFAPWCGHCKRFLPEAKKAAEIFNTLEENASVAIMNCDMYRSYCTRFEIKGFPTIKLFVDGKPVVYSGNRTAESVAEIINKNCGTHRQADGLVTDDYGVIPAAQKIAADFAAAQDKNALITNAKAVPGANFYVQAMERIASQGAEKVKADFAVMQKLLQSRAGSPKTLDELKRRINILKDFKL